VYIVQKLDEVFCKNQVGPFDLWCDLVLEFLFWIFVWMTNHLVVGGVLKSPTNTLLESIYAFRSFRVCLMKLYALTLGAYRLIIVISFWCISPFITMECPSLSHLINVGLKSNLSEISISTPTCFGGPMADKSSPSLLP
jgi:hypothetical protein